MKRYITRSLSPLYPLTPLQGLPEVVCIEEPGKLRVNVHHMHISLLMISDNRLVVVPGIVAFDVNAQGAVDLQLQSVPLCISFSTIRLTFEVFSSLLTSSDPPPPSFPSPPHPPPAPGSPVPATAISARPAPAPASRPRSPNPTPLLRSGISACLVRRSATRDRLRCGRRLFRCGGRRAC